MPRNPELAALAAERAREVRDVRFDDGTRALYATDASNYRQVPIGVVFPRDATEVVATIAVCRRHGAPVLPRGGGTSLAGQCCNVAVVLDFSRYMNAILEIDSAGRRARVQPGLVLDELRDAAEREQLTFGPDPSTHSRCTLGGMIGNNSCGVHSVMAGKTEENVDELEVVLYDGTRMRVGLTSDTELQRIIAEGGRRAEIYAGLRALHDRYGQLVRERYPDIPRRVSGYNLNQLLPENGFHVARALVGSEGTCVTVLEATVRLVRSPPARTLVAVGYPDVYTAGDHVAEILTFKPIGLEGFDDVLIEHMKKKGLHPGSATHLPQGRGWLLVEFGGDTKADADAQARALERALGQHPNAPNVKIFDDERVTRMIWRIRESGLGATARVPGERDSWEGWEDAAVPPERLGHYLREFRQLLDRYGFGGSLYGHFGQGCVHTRIDFDLETKDGVGQYRAFVSDAADLVVRYGGSLSGEHGDGQSRAELLPKMFGPELVRAFAEFKAIWDPDNRMNPGKVVNANRLDENLRLGPNYAPRRVKTHFQFSADDRGDLARATLRCVGVGECRRLHAGTMCPSYMVTKEEKHSTRGRARLLFEMLQGEVITDGWKSESVREALDLCLACKGCKHDCPVNVDMATYKAEFLSHYYAGRVRPRHAYAFGLIGRWARLVQHAPALANFFTQTPGLTALARSAAGIAPQRQIPRFASAPFKRRIRTRAQQNGGSERVILWADTFNNHFHPETLEAALGVLERAGYQVNVPRDWFCCGRPLYDYGMLDTARRWLRRILVRLRAEIRAGVPVIGLEPSCVAVFRDELPNLFPQDEDAMRLSRQAYHLSEFLEQRTSFSPPPLERNAIVHGHCHHKSVLAMDEEITVLTKLGLNLTVLDAGCCGMAGAFGFEREHYDVSIKCGERVLLPAVRSAPSDTLIIADGFSCREQIAQSTGRRALHVAEVLEMALGAQKK
ncbi:MAG TPA: FAD-binding and (Fe-S)-binding domain-containing protein [Gemmatimonadaceae bacterium]|nr:FAD-binding and (Fe-S)-binding domain-containing protein [Gemmatimonadaceae bacterium]